MALAEDDPCPSEEALFGGVEGLLGRPQREALDRHLDRCAECRATVAALAQLRSWSCHGGRGSEPEVGSTAEGEQVVAGDRLGAYEIVGLCGRGGMGAVFEAYDPRLDRRVAIKVVLPRLASPEGRRRLVAEARELARISHPNVVTVYEVEEHGDSVYLVMELVEGASLGAWAEAEGRSLEALLPALAGVAEGLAAAHRGGIVHRDVKPSNIVVGADGRPRVIDFGLALGPSVASGRAEEGSPSGAGAEPGGGRGRGPSLVGTPAYMAPELLGGAQADARSDLFALAVTAYEVLHGRRPFVAAGGSPAQLRAAIAAGPEGRWRSDLPGELRRLLLAGVSEDPAARPTAEAFARGFRPQGRGAPRMIATLTATAALAGAIAFGLGSGAVDAEERLCSPESAAAEVAESWNPRLRAALSERYREGEVVDGGRIVASMAAQLDRRVEEWEVLHAELCEPSPAQESVAEGDRLARAGLRTARLACLDLRLAEIDGLVELLLGGDRELLALGPRFLDELRDIDHCRRQDFADVEAPLPEDGAARAEAIPEPLSSKARHRRGSAPTSSAARPRGSGAGLAVAQGSAPSPRPSWSWGRPPPRSRAGSSRPPTWPRPAAHVGPTPSRRSSGPRTSASRGTIGAAQRSGWGTRRRPWPRSATTPRSRGSTPGSRGRWRCAGDG